MKVLLLRDSRINYEAGEIVEVSPVQASFLLSVGSAVELHDEVRIETPVLTDAVEIPEKKKTATRRKKNNEVTDRSSNA